MQPKATFFKFTSYAFEPDKQRIIFNYKTEFTDRESLIFTETVLLPSTPNLENIPKEVTEKLLQSLHIILGISYYKLYCPPTIALAKEGATLSKTEADFWNIIYKKGLGEFFYKNELNPKTSPKFPHAKNVKTTNYKLPTTNSRCLVGIGGGKDSIVATELLKEAGFKPDALFIKTGNNETLVSGVIKTLDIKSLKIERHLDWQVHQQHQYNGHIPISAIYAFLGLMSSIFYGYSYIVVGNEHSSNFGNIKYKGLDINHQWSKSFEFESLFQNYVKNSISPDVLYFSLLRSFYEIRIVKMFAKYKQYFPYFSSCNKNFTINKQTGGGLWCGQCPKCVFVFTLLSAFLSKKELLNIFGKNLYQDKALLPLFKDILGFGTMKPFDCVGTFKESQTALFLAKNKFKGDFIVAQLSGSTPPSGVRQLGKQVKYHKEVFQTAEETAIPEQFKFLGIEIALIAGFGKEGKTTKQYLKKYYPKIKVGIADSKQGSDYLKQQKHFDIAVKTPGIQKELITIPYTTATNIFFSHLQHNRPIDRSMGMNQNLIIGVTGSKGKSTTASLIYHILKSSGKDVALLGNIGTPMLGALLHPIPKDRIFVLELSSYQLSDLHFSPDIAVVTNLFPEHLDYHGNLKNYYHAKKNIIKFQNQNQYFVYNEKTTTWLKGYQGKAVPFSEKTFESNLIGAHNQSNIGAAVSVAEILKIPEATIKSAIKKFKGLPHRLEFVGEFQGVKFYDDAISTTPESTIMAIESLPKISTIFLGGTDRGYNFIQLEKTIKKYRIKNIVLFPDSGNRILKSTKDLNILKTNSMKKAVAFAYQNAQKGLICLLSCASPSYSLWKNFEQKGDQFQKFVKELGK